MVTQRQGINSTEYVVFNRFLEEGHADNAELEKMIFEQDGEFKTIYSAVWTLIT